MTLTETQVKIRNKFDNSQDFLPYIDEIRFPMYKSLEADLSIRFNWPIVALIGSNGTNKSSVLQAISAAPEGRSLAQFWFSTAVDDIDSGMPAKAGHRFVYKYRFDASGMIAECRKYRGSKKYRNADVPKALRGKRDPDYWEPTKRVASDGMAAIPDTGFELKLSKNRDRWNQIKKGVVYLDFRSELSAFDKYIHHQSFNHWTPDAVWKRFKVVERSQWIAKALAGSALPKRQADRLIENVRELSASDVEVVAKILGKPIDSIKLVKHRFFGPTGYTVRICLRKAGAVYSEAHAGSGEYAVVRLVDAIRRAPQRSLILLDEPEVSLHPGAQTELLNFIESEVLKHGHQVVMSTHSPSLAAELPPQAIKVLGFDANRQHVVLLADGCSPTEAFAHLGHATLGPMRPRLIVEDELAAEMVRASLRRHAATKLDSLEIVPFPGGADGIVKNVLSTFTLAGFQTAAILLDGDQLPPTASTTCDVGCDAGGAKVSRDLDSLKGIWTRQFHRTLPRLHSNSGGGTDVEVLYNSILWADDHLGFLPGKTPEEAIAVESGLVPAGSVQNWKNYWTEKVRSDLQLTDKEIVTSEQIFQNQQAVLAGLPDGSSLLKDIFETVNHILAW